MSRRNEKKKKKTEIGSHYFSFFALSNLLTQTCLYFRTIGQLTSSEHEKLMKSSFPKRYKSILIVLMKMTFFYLDPYILLIFNLSC